jgi:hypothetical protein
MKALLLIENDKVADLATVLIEPLGFEAMRYRNPLKALDNLAEIGPDAVVISAQDYPRHWKIMAAIIRAERNKDECVLILLKGAFFPYEEAAKAAHLGVNGVVSEDLGDRREQALFQRLLKRYKAVDEARTAERLSPAAWDRLDFMFSHPKTLAPVVGKLDTLSLSGLSFLPESPTICADILPGTTLDDCSLRAGDRILSLSCEVVRSERILGLAIGEMEDEERSYYEDYLRACPDREMHALLKKA